MNKADLLMAGLRQLAAGKAVPRTGTQSATPAKDGKDKAEHFREQLRLIAQGTKHAAKPAAEGADKDVTQGEEVRDHAAKAADQVPVRSKGRTVQPDEIASHQAAQEATSTPPDWRGPEAALSSVMSKLDQSQAFSAPDDDAAARVAQPQIHVERKEAPSKVEEAAKNLKADVVPDQRFSLSVESAETRSQPPPVKVAVREQETHFEPVQQLTLLQKVVDRIGADLQAASTPAATGPADVALPDMHRAADKPVRMLTLQLEPPSIGSVTVRMRMAGDAVEIHLSADRAETTEMLRQERGALTDLMKSAGYTFEIASIDHTRATDAGPGAGQSQTQSDQQQPQQSHGGSQIGNGASERRSGDTQGETRHNRQEHDQRPETTERKQDQEAVVVNRNGGALYL
jgi:chemotaxis protein MotD